MKVLCKHIYTGPILAVSRTLTAFSTLATIVFTPVAKLFAPAEGRHDPIVCEGGYKNINYFCWEGKQEPRIAIFLSIIILFMVIWGTIPWITSLLHFYLAFFLNKSLAIPDGGDQLCVFLTLFFAIAYFGDMRTNHWQTLTKLLAWIPYTSISAVFLIKAQMSIIYLNAAIHKMAKDDWREGSTLYYLLGGSFEPSGFAYSIYSWMVYQPFITVALTWGSMVIELLLGIVIFTNMRWRYIFFIIGLLFHVGIIFFLGITTFQIAMIAGLIILVVPFNNIWFYKTARFFRWRDFGCTQMPHPVFA